MPPKTESTHLPTSRDEAFRVEEFCALFRIGKTKFYEEVASGRLKTFPIGRRRRVSRAAAEAWVRGLEGLANDSHLSRFNTKKADRADRSPLK